MGKRGPQKGKPKPYEARIVSLVSQGMTQAEIANLLDLPDADPDRKIRRIMRKIEDACRDRGARRLYEKGINSSRKPDDANRLIIYSVGYDAHQAFPELTMPCSPRLLTQTELFEAIDDGHRKAVAAAMKSLDKTTPK